MFAITAHECDAVGSQQLDRATRSQLERTIELAKIADLDRGADDAVKLRAAEPAAQDKRRNAAGAADERLADVQSETGRVALRDEIRTIAEIRRWAADRRRAQVQMPGR